MKQWYYAQKGERKGPVDATVIQELYQTGQLLAEDLVWEEGMPDWVPASQVLNLAAPFTPPPSPSSASIPAPSFNPAPFPTTTAKKDSTLAIVSLISGIVSLPTLFCSCCGLIAILPVVTGHLALSEIKKNPGLGGHGMALAGLIMGYFTIALMALIFLVTMGMAFYGNTLDKH